MRISQKRMVFFGLTSYITYASEQIKKSHEWISNTAKSRLSAYEFPWRRIDDSNIETHGFIRNAFEFTLDQGKILDLLTGHTLYNDTNVVLREMVQNAIDAIRLQNFPHASRNLGQIQVLWNTTKRTLSVVDNGTGMTQDIINNFLLKVGSSRYQDPEFRKQNPGFNSISRFGIGVLSTFMIADSVEIISCHPQEDKARRLALRSVHGKYLISLLDKDSDEVRSITPHGTFFQLRVRPSVDIGDIIQTAKQWIVIPDCKVTVQIDNRPPIEIGFSSPAEALRDFIRSSGTDYTEDAADESTDSNRLLIRIVEHSKHGIDLAYALRWNKWFKEWSFLTPSSLDTVIRPAKSSEKERPLMLGTSVEGIRIVNDTPGFTGHPIVAIANVKGQSAPRTNVARSGLEVTPEREVMLGIIYAMYASHVINEISELTSTRFFSPTWAIGEVNYLISPLLDFRGEARPLNRKLLNSAIQTIPGIMVEEQGVRSSKSPEELATAPMIWTIDCGLLASAEELIREVASAASLTEIVKALKVVDFDLPNAPVISGAPGGSRLSRFIFEQREVDQIVVDPKQRRVDLRWVQKTSPNRWMEVPEENHAWFTHVFRERFQSRRRTNLEMPLIPNTGVTANVPNGETAIKAFGYLFLVPGTDIANFAKSCMERLREDRSHEQILVVVCVLGVITQCIEDTKAPPDVDSVRKTLRYWEGQAEALHLGSRVEDLFDLAEFAKILTNASWKSFDTSAWRRDERMF